MSKNMLLDYAIKFSEIEGTQEADISYLHRVGIVVKANTAPPDAPVFSQDPLPAYQEINIGSTGVLEVIVEGATELMWQTSMIGTQDADDWTDTGLRDTRILPPAPADGETVYYRCRATNSLGVAISAVAVVVGNDPNKPPVITEEMTVTVTAPPPETSGFLVEQFLKAKAERSQAITTNYAGRREAKKTRARAAVPAQLVEVYSATEALEHTNNADVKGLFDGGLNRVTLIKTWDDPINEFELAALDDGDFFTILISSDIPQAINENFTATGFDGVWGVMADDKSKAKRIAASKNHCCFYDEYGSAYGMCFAFGNLLSGVYWRDQQYIQVASNTVFTVGDLGEAESLFNDRVSFYMSDEQYGDRLGFFGAGGDAITVPYINEEIKRVIQGTGLNYLAINMPRNTIGERIRLQSRLQDVIETYLTAPYYYLDPDADNRIILFASNEKYIVNGTLTACVADPIWRVFIEARQGSCS